MSLLYTISNVCIPFSLLIYETLKRGSQGKQANYGKWLVLFAVTFIFNGLSIFNSWVITLVDLCLKIGIYFLPENMNEIIEDRIRNLHFQGIIQSYRCKVVNKLFQFYSKMTQFLLSQLREEESQQFEEALVDGLKNKQTKTQLTLQPKQKLMSNKEVQCAIISQKNIQQAKALFDKKLKYIEKQKEQLEKSRVQFQKRSNSNNKKYEAEKEYPEVKAEKPTKNKIDISKTMTQTMPAGGFKSKMPQIKQLVSSSSIKNLAQSSQFLPEDFQAQEEVQKPVSKLIYSRNRDEQKPVQSKKAAKKEQGATTGHLKRSNTTLQGLKINASNVASRERSYSPDGSSLKEQAQILQKLDLSVSQYSDMFEEEDIEDQKDQSKKIVCKVEAIVQIGSAPNSRLEIYNLQLYSNRDLRIISLYNREFEKHKLVSVSKGINNYHDLHLSGSTVTKRRVKFRGQHQAFLKYIQPK